VVAQPLAVQALVVVALVVLTRLQRLRLAQQIQALAAVVVVTHQHLLVAVKQAVQDLLLLDTRLLKGRNMAHFAEVLDGVVVRVLVVPDAEEHRGQDFLADDLALGGTWVQTSYNNRIRKNYAGIGMTYDATLDAFIAPKCHDEATFDKDNAGWSCPNENHEFKTIYDLTDHDIQLPKEITNDNE
jgi:hypothetical protein